MELMTNSDNVMRGGLTTKHLDVTELIHILDFSSHPPNIIRPQAGAAGEEYYPTPADEFQLSRITLNHNQIYLKNNLTSVEILFCISGQARVTNAEASLSLAIRQGEAVLITAQAGAYQLQGEGVFYLAGVPREA
jgi:mannose-6-phosphate isomerase